MNKKYVIGGVLVVLIIVGGLGAALYTGVGPAPGGNSGDEIEEFPTEEDTDVGGSEATSTEDAEPFTFSIDDIEACGSTCRDVTSSLTNNQDETATNVTVYVRIFAGEDNTNSADMVWEGTEEVGTMEAGGTHTTTERVELSLQEGLMIDQEDGWITILTTVQSDDTTVTFQSSEQVA
ncbi:MAG: hypothetical protein U5K70_01260 [Halodesulfurarchaeum sp.]|nr:hypothetical protein [Halodesulfurarchaeum sp.]